MTDVTLKAVLLGEDRSAGSALNKVGTEAEKSQGKLHSFGKVAGGVFAGLAATMAAQKVGEFLKGSIDAASQDQAAQRTLALALKNTTNASGAQIKSTQDWITQQSLATGVSKDELMPAFQRLAESSGSVTKAQKEMKIAMDVSAGTGKNLATVSSALMKANNGTTSSLSRLGLKTKTTTVDTLGLAKAHLAIKTSQTAVTAALAKYGAGSVQARTATLALKTAHQSLATVQLKGKSTTLTLNQALHTMSDTFGGQAAAKAKSFDGTMQRLHTTFHEVEVKVGTALIPILQHAADWFMKKGIPAIEQFGRALKDKLSGAFDFVKRVIQRLEPVFGKIIGWIKNNPQTVQAFASALVVLSGAVGALTAVFIVLNSVMTANPIGLIVVALAALVGAFVYAYTHSKKFKEIVQASMHAVTDVVHKAVDLMVGFWHKFGGDITSLIKTIFATVKGVISGYLKIIQGVFKVAFALFHGDWKGAWDGIKQIVSGVLQIIKTYISGWFGIVKTLFHAGWTAVQMIVKGAWDLLTKAVMSGLTASVTLVKSLPGKIKSALGNLGKLLYSAGTQIVAGLVSGITSRVSGLMSTVSGLAGKVSGAFKGALGIHSPSRVFIGHGQNIIDGLIQGIRSRQVALSTVLSSVTTAVQAAGSKLQAAISARDSFAAGFQSFSTSIFGASYGTDANGNPIAPDAASIIAYQKRQAHQAHLVKKDVKSLVHKGLSPALLKQLQSQGAAGMAEIQALANASPAQIAQLNHLNAQTASNLHGAGMVAGNSIYGSAIAKDQQRYNETKKLLSEIRDAVKGQNEKHLVARLNGGDLEIALVHHQRVHKGGKKMAFQKP